MKKKLLFIGNSHIGSIRAGFEIVNKNVLTNYQFSFCAASRNNFYKHRLVGDRFEFDKSVINFNYNLESHIDLHQYDYCICVFNVSPLARLKHKDYSFYSKALLKNYIEKLYWLKTQEQDCCDLVLSIYKLINQKFIFVGAPLTSQFNHELWHDNSYYTDQITNIREICDSYFDAPDKPKILLPPEYLLNNSGFYTIEKYLKGALNADGQMNMNPKNKNHMNAEYGKIIILELLRKLQQ
jgi:hypothetical protein